MSTLWRSLLLVGLMSACGLAQAFGLADLSRQLGEAPVVKGAFIQEKHLRALPQPLVSKGHFVLTREHGLLWLLQTPVQQDVRLNANGIARRDAGRWQMLPGSAAGTQQNKLFFAVLQGDSSGLQRDFELNLQGSAEHWQLRLTPRSLLLKQIFTQINIDGGRFVERIELRETQGDSTLLRMPESTRADSLTETEQRDFAD
ncbi:outer membrane lipoprotein carrier protein LolA [Pseudomonas fontis]|uniref:Outer membrane lipoprotein carrier protein LolA n=1 Tax=Pseudomonas fontis TaxID=2942633 RepID=A0ABT5NS25_9PSED|nr:outer membrane lipoprotein carrier protein LolA [Pseudomonas fontis]MDD0973669.1 outer membrane lipoprotein carrier protein LolA [Pseudomonas fontis]MDD0990966.1 outer membrane lipoprotein carrier protein LolA [Pseudomonas fontis]